MLTPAEYVTTPGGWGQEAGVWDRAKIEAFASIQFQNGPVAIHGVNGVTEDDILKAVVDRLRAQQRHAGSRDRAMVITKLDEARHWLRSLAETENTREKAVERAGGQG